MRTLSRRLLLLEQSARPVRPPEVKVFYDDDVAVCAVHARCSVEKLTGQHHAGVLKLTFAQVAHE